MTEINILDSLGDLRKKINHQFSMHKEKVDELVDIPLKGIKTEDLEGELINTTNLLTDLGILVYNLKLSKVELNDLTRKGGYNSPIKRSIESLRKEIDDFGHGLYYLTESLKERLRTIRYLIQ